jgi:2-C-methyl-D-erythritol 4-phosphate cytidylyltransferase
MQASATSLFGEWFMAHQKLSVILPAAGNSTRFGAGEKKTFISLDGRAVWLRTAELFVNRPDLSEIILVISAEDEELVRFKFHANLAFMNVKLVIGGAERVDSVRSALGQLDPSTDLVLIHDAVRPCVSSEKISEVVAMAGQTGAAILATQVVQTVKRVSGNSVIEDTVSRKNLWLAQTPQVFRRDVILRAYQNIEKLDTRPTDDAEVVEASGYPVTVVPCPYTNIKITTREDLALAELILKAKVDTAPRNWHPFADEDQW